MKWTKFLGIYFIAFCGCSGSVELLILGLFVLYIFEGGCMHCRFLEKIKEKWGILLLKCGLAYISR